ncbi:MAG: hypothetical protein J0I93_09310 [Legionella sp.]|nr:hypothetical protein [Legionella sp.]
METVFLKSLKFFVIKELVGVIAVEEDQSKNTLIYNASLSLTQSDALYLLIKDIANFEGHLSDQYNTQAILEMVATTYSAIQSIREKKAKNTTHSTTLDVLSALQKQITQFHSKVTQLIQEKPSYPQELLNTPFLQNPIHYSYRILLEYIAMEITKPSSDPNIHREKEEGFVERLHYIRLQSNQSFKDLSSFCLKEFNEMHIQNKEIVKEAPNISFFGKITEIVSKYNGIPLTPKFASTTRMKSLMHKASRLTENLAEEYFESNTPKDKHENLENLGETIFLKVVKSLIVKKLALTIAEEMEKALTKIHNSILSYEQADILIELMIHILEYNPPQTDDDEILKVIKNLISNALCDVKNVRIKHGVSEHEGVAVDSLSMMLNKPREFYKKIKDFEANNTYSCVLLNTKALKNPFHYIYQLLLEYIGKEIFTPCSSPEKHREKEAVIAQRVSTLILDSKISFSKLKDYAIKELEEMYQKIQLDDDTSLMSLVIPKSTFLDYLIPRAIQSIKSLNELDYEPLSLLKSEPAEDPELKSSLSPV